MRFYSVQEAKWITLGAQAKKPGTKGANGKKHGGVAVLIGDDGVILKGPKHMQGKKPDELGGRQKTLGEKPGEKQEPRKYQNLAFGPDGEIAEPDAPKSPPPGTGYSDLRAAAKVEPVAAPPAPTAAKPAKTKAAKSQKPPENYDDKQDKKHARNLARLEKSRKELADIGDAARTLLAKAPPEMHAKIQDMIDRADAEKNNLAAALKPTEFPDMGEPPPMVTDYTPGADYSNSYDDLRKAAAQPAPEPAPATAPAPAKPAKAPKAARVKPEPKPEPVVAPTPEPKPEKGETVRAKIARIKAEKEKRYNDTLKKRGKKEADKQKADDKRQAKAEKDALNPAQAEARKKKQVERISKINAARPESLISLVRKEGGISGGDYDYATDIKEFGLKSAMNKRGLKLDDMAKALQNAGHLVVPEGKKAEDVLLAGLQTRANSALHNHTGRYDSEYDDFINNREDADNAQGADSDRTAAVISRGEEAGTDQGDDDSLAQILGFEPSRSDADEPEPSDYGHPDDYEPSDYEPEEGDLGDGGEITGADTSFDFGAPEPPPAPAPSPASPPVDMFGNATTTAKKQPDMMTDMFGARIQSEAPKVTATPTVADDAAKSLDWLDKNDPKKDGSAEMFGSLFSPGASGASAKTQPEAPGEGYADLRAAAAREPEATPAVGKPAHEMTKAEFLAQAPTDKAKQYMDTSSMHRNKVQAALDGGQNVPSEVLANYPGIKKTEPQPQQGPTAREIKAKLQAETDARQAQGEQDEANVRARNNQDYQKSRQADIDAGQDVEDGDEKQIRRYIRQNEKDKASALGTIARNGPDTDAQDFADSMDKENNRLKAKLPKVAKPAAPPTVKPSTPAPGTGFADLRAAAAKGPEAPTITPHKADKTYLQLLKKSKNLVGASDDNNGIYEIDKKHLKPEILQKLRDPESKGRKYYGDAPETDSFRLAWKHDVTGDPNDDGVMIIDKRQHSIAQAKKRAERMASAGKTEKGEQAQKKQKEDDETERKVLKWLEQNPDSTHSELRRRTGHPTFDSSSPMDNPAHAAVDRLEKSGKITRSKGDLPSFSIADEQPAPAPAPTPATAPEPGTGYDDLRAAAAKKPLPPTPPAGLADRIAKRGTPTTIGPAKPVDPTDYNDPKEKARIAAFISRDLSGAASPKAAAKKLVRDLPFLSPEKFRARLDAVKSEFPEIYQAFKEDPGIAGPDAHAEIAAHTGGEPPKEFPGAAPSRIPGEGYADLRAAAAKEPEAPPAPPEAPTAKGPDRRSYAERISAGESPEKIMAELDQRSDIARSQRDRPEATPAEKATAQAEIQHARNVSDDKARADVAEKMNKKAADAKSLASVEKPKITIEKSIGYSGKTGDPSYLAKISGKHNGKTFNREFQNGDEDKKAKSDAFRKKKGTYNETHEISPGELYEHAQNGTKKLLAIQPALDGGTAGQKVSFEIAELKEASKILKSFDDSETPNPNGFGANADFVKPLLAHQAKMAKKAGSYEGLTLPVVAKDLEGS